METNRDLRRRWLGGVFLGAALVMLVVGQTIPRDSLSNVGWVVFWLVCLVFTCLSIIVAFWDLAAVRRRTRAEQRALLESTLKEIAREKDAKQKRQDQSPR